MLRWLKTKCFVYYCGSGSEAIMWCSFFSRTCGFKDISSTLYFCLTGLRRPLPRISFLKARNRTCNAPCWQIIHLHRLCSLWRYTDICWPKCKFVRCIFYADIWVYSNYELYEYVITQYFDTYIYMWYIYICVLCSYLNVIPQYLTEIDIHIHLFSRIPLIEDMLCSWSIHICVFYIPHHLRKVHQTNFCDESMYPFAGSE